MFHVHSPLKGHWIIFNFFVTFSAEIFPLDRTFFPWFELVTPIVPVKIHNIRFLPQCSGVRDTGALCKLSCSNVFSFTPLVFKCDAVLATLSTRYVGRKHREEDGCGHQLEDLPLPSFHPSVMSSFLWKESMGEVEEGCSSQIPSGSIDPSLQQAVLWPHKGLQGRWWGLRTPLQRPSPQWLTTCIEVLDVFRINLCRFCIKYSMLKHIKVFYLTQIILKTDLAHMFSH